MTASAHTPRPWYRETFVWLLIGLPATAVVAGLFTLYLAIDSQDGLVADDYYQQGKTINRVLARDQAAARYGLSGDLALDPAKGQVHVVLRAGKRDIPARVRLRLLHATRGSFDQSVELERGADNLYHAALPDLIPGRWHVQLEADDWRLTGVLSAPGERAAKLQPAL